MSELRELAEPFPAAMVEKAPVGKFGSYVTHSNYTQRALSILGPHTFGAVDLIRGYAPAIKTENNSWPARENAVVGVVAELTVTIDGKEVTITEIGTEDNPAMKHDAECAKNALSDAYKRCWMRVGLGLHLWSKKPRDYFLAIQLDKEEEQ